MKKLLISIDLERNPDGSLTGIDEVLEKLASIIPWGTIFVTPSIVDEKPQLIKDLNKNFDIGLHVHPEDDLKKLGDLNRKEQRNIIENGKRKIESVVGGKIRSFRAGDHSVSDETFDILHELDFNIDASLNPNYTYDFTESYPNSPFELGEVLEVPLTIIRPSLLSRLGVSILPFRSFTTAASAFRARYIFTSGKNAVLNSLEIGLKYYSIYFHPYDFMEKYFNRPLEFDELSEFIEKARKEDYELIRMKDLL